jgi:hypothetical protein
MSMITLPTEAVERRDTFTPGPWFAGKSEGRGALCVQSESTWICGEIDNESDHRFDSQEAVANAHLIAASPCQNAALIKAERFIAGFEGDELQEGVGELLSEIRAALAKARAPKCEQST